MEEKKKELKKYEKPELEITRFCTSDIVTNSVSQQGSAMEGDCVGTAADNFNPSC